MSVTSSRNGETSLSRRLGQGPRPKGGRPTTEGRGDPRRTPGPRSPIAPRAAQASFDQGPNGKNPAPGSMAPAAAGSLVFAYLTFFFAVLRATAAPRVCDWDAAALGREARKLGRASVPRRSDSEELAERTALDCSSARANGSPAKPPETFAVAGPPPATRGIPSPSPVARNPPPPPPAAPPPPMPPPAPPPPRPPITPFTPAPPVTAAGTENVSKPSRLLKNGLTLMRTYRRSAVTAGVTVSVVPLGKDPTTG
jgi:hypothetical protein